MELLRKLDFLRRIYWASNLKEFDKVNRDQIFVKSWILQFYFISFHPPWLMWAINQPAPFLFIKTNKNYFVILMNAIWILSSLMLTRAPSRTFDLLIQNPHFLSIVEFDEWAYRMSNVIYHQMVNNDAKKETHLFTRMVNQSCHHFGNVVKSTQKLCD